MASDESDYEGVQADDVGAKRRKIQLKLTSKKCKACKKYGHTAGFVGSGTLTLHPRKPILTLRQFTWIALTGIAIFVNFLVIRLQPARIDHVGERQSLLPFLSGVFYHTFEAESYILSNL
jgi:hypothetical protein